MLVKKQNGELEPFDPFKLESSLLRSGAKPGVVDEVVAEIMKDLTEGISTGKIYRKAFSLLKKRQRGLAARYSLKKAIAELGPSGFPFEELIARVFEAQGYSTRTGVTVQGKCTTHEVDVIAHRGEELFLIEAKFHNDESLKSDTKDALYIKARFDDLRDTVVTFSAEISQKMTKGILMTNTKFSTGAIEYAECAGLTLLGWSYPKNASLRDLVEKSGLQPLTCLTTLSRSQKRILIENGAILCDDLKKNPDLLKQVGMGEKDITNTLSEVEEVLLMVK